MDSYFGGKLVSSRTRVKNYFLRLNSFLLALCIIADPALAAAMSPHRSTVGKSVAIQDRISQEGLAASALNEMQPLSLVSSPHTHKVTIGGLVKATWKAIWGSGRLASAKESNSGVPLPINAGKETSPPMSGIERVVATVRDELLGIGFSDESLKTLPVALKDLFPMESGSKGFEGVGVIEDQLTLLRKDMKRLLAEKEAQANHTVTVYEVGLGAEPNEALQFVSALLQVIDEESEAGHVAEPKAWTILFFAVDVRPEPLSAAGPIFERINAGNLQGTPLKKVRVGKLFMKAFEGDAVDLNTLERISKEDIPRALQSQQVPKADYLLHRFLLYITRGVQEPGHYINIPLSASNAPHKLTLFLDSFFQIRNVLSAFGKEGTRYVVEPTFTGTERDTPLREVKDPKEETGNQVLMLPGCRLQTIAELMPEWVVKRGSLADRSTGIIEVVDLQHLTHMGLQEFQQAIRSSTHLGLEGELDGKAFHKLRQAAQAVVQNLSEPQGPHLILADIPPTVPAADTTPALPEEHLSEIDTFRDGHHGAGNILGNLAGRLSDFSKRRLAVSVEESLKHVFADAISRLIKANQSFDNWARDVDASKHSPFELYAVVAPLRDEILAAVGAIIQFVHEHDLLHAQPADSKSVLSIEYLERVRDEVRRILIPELHLEDVDLTAWLQSYQGLLDDELTVPSNAIVARTDRSALGQILKIGINNALDLDNVLEEPRAHDPRLTRIRVDLSEEGVEAVIRVRDNGRGMTSATLARVRGVLDGTWNEVFTTKATSEGLQHGRGFRIIRRLSQAIGAAVTIDSRPQDPQVSEEERQFVTTLTSRLPLPSIVNTHSLPKKLLGFVFLLLSVSHWGGPLILQSHGDIQLRHPSFALSAA